MANGITVNLAKELGGKTSGNLKLPVSALFYDPNKDARDPKSPSILSHVEDLANKIREQGYLSDFPIKARPDKNGKRFEIVNGRNRFRAMQLIVESKDFGKWDGYAEVTPTRPDISEEEFYFNTLQGNNDAQKPFTASEEGFYFHRLNESGKKSMDEIAKRIGKSIAYVKDRIDLAKMPNSELKKEIESFVNSGIMSPTAAIEIAKKPEEERNKIWEDVKKKHNENMQSNSNQLSSGKKSTKKGIKVSDIKNAGKKSAPSDHISIRVIKSNMDVCRKMFDATKSEIWEKSLYVLEQTFAGKIIQA